MVNHGAAAALQTYSRNIDAVQADGEVTEYSYHLPLQQLLECMGGKDLRVLHKPQQAACGAPALVVERGGVTMGYVACKGITVALDQVAATGQLEHYRHGLANLILTNYREFRWYFQGKLCRQVCLGHPDERHGLRLESTAFAGIATLLQGFFGAAPVVINRSEALARTMAAKACLLRDAIVCALAQDKGTGPLHELWQIYRQVFITDLPAADFADLQAQTTTYGLFAARCGHPPGIPFTRQSAIFIKTTTFLQDVFARSAGPGLDQRLAWIVDDLVCLLDQADMTAMLKDFKQRSQREDPVVHFYEDFLKAYNPSLKEIRGVYYTPESVVSYIVCSVDQLLRDRFDLSSGLAHMSAPGEKYRVLILDPAVGTGTFLREVIVHIRTTLERQGLAHSWPEYVKQHLLPRLFGFELLMAPYAMSHLKLALELGYEQKQGLQFMPGQHLNVFLANTLEGGHRQVQDVLTSHAIAHEAIGAGEIKREKPVMVVIGNPPYSGHSANQNIWINQLLRGKGDARPQESYFHVDGQPLREKNMKWLNDDYVKFIRFAQWRIEKTGEGILAFVTNHSYLDSPTFRGMRRSLMETFDDLYLLDLHGNTRRQEKAPDGSRDMNVFDIQQGVAIGLFVKHDKGSHRLRGNVFWAELWGARDAGPGGGKYGWLAAHDVKTTPWKHLLPRAPSYLFVPRNEKLEKEYEQGWKITDIFLSSSVGIVTARDKLSIQLSMDKLQQVVHDFSRRDREDARRLYDLGEDTRDWSVQRAQQDLKDHPHQDRHAMKILYRPFDQRFTYYTGRGCGFICKPRRKVMRHMLDGSNLALCIGRAGQATGSQQWDVVLVAQTPTDLNLFRRGGNCLFPLYRYLQNDDMTLSPARKHNLSPDFIKANSDALGLSFVPDGPGDLVRSFGPEDVLHSIYAVLHSPTYRRRYQDHLKSDFPFLPQITNPHLFADLVHLGQRLVALHLLEEAGQDMPTFPNQGNNCVENIAYASPQKEHPGQVWINAKQCFHGVAPATWSFTIGGYCPAQKWLNSRKGHGLSFADLHHYRHLCAALATTRCLMATIDATIARHGGWPLTSAAEC